MSSSPVRARKIQVHTLSADFRAATKIVEVELPTPKADEVRVRNCYVGINASDINYTNGKYLPGVKAPFDAGFESVGVIEAVGSDVKGFRVGQAVGVTGYGAFAERQVLRARGMIPLPAARAQYLPLMVSALTASIALEQTGEMRQVGSGSPPARKETVLVTAAAGGTGLFAVQLAVAAGHTVIATCSSDDKVSLLQKLGVHRVINYKREDFASVLRKEFPKGIDIVYESVGGDMFNVCAANLAVKGRLVIIGFISGYSDGSGWKGKAKEQQEQGQGQGKNEAGSAAAAASPAKKAPRPSPPLPALLLGKSASVRGFFLNDFAPLFGRHMKALSAALEEGRLQSVVDHEQEGGRRFVGLEQVPDAIDYLYAGKNLGKVVVDIRSEEDKSKEQQQTSARHTKQQPSKL